MATNGNDAAFTPTVILAALATIKGTDQAAKKKAIEHLEQFQKSKAAWGATFAILKSGADAEGKMFAAVTIRGKITYDLATQVPSTEWTALRAEILLLLKHFAAGPKPLRVALSVSLAVLAIQMTQWKDVLQTVVEALGNQVESHACILDFLRVLPEEVTEGRRIPLSEEELSDRAKELLRDNVDQVVQLLLGYAQSSAAAAQNPQLIECITSWLREIPVATVVKSPLLDIIFNGVANDATVNESAECLCAILSDTMEVEENVEVIELLYPRVVGLRQLLSKAAGEEDADTLKAVTKVMAKAAQSWSVAIARHPKQFRPLVEGVLECAAVDKDLDAIEYTFEFWYDFRMYLVLEKYEHSRRELLDIFPKLVTVLLERMQFPEPESGNEKDLFEGDREQEDKFREFRHRIGDTLKDAADVMGVPNCLKTIYDAVSGWMQKYGGQATAGVVPHWQIVESPIFAMRALGGVVSRGENEVLPRLIPLLTQLPDHGKLRFAITMAFGRYTEWTAEHPEFLQPQFGYIVASFDSGSLEVIRAASMAMRYICIDCKMLLSGQVLQLQAFYDQILDKLTEKGQEELTQGVASVVAIQPVDKIHGLLKQYCDPLLRRLMAKADAAADEKAKCALADQIQLITCFVQHVVPLVEDGQENPAVQYWQDVFPILSTILDNFGSFTPICERICRCWRSMLISYRTAMTPVLPELAGKLAQGFEATHEGCFLWTTGAVLREFSEHREHVDPQTSDDIYAFFQAQALTFLRALNGIQPKELPDVIEDFFHLLLDALLYYPHKLIPSELLTSIFEAATYALVLEQREPVDATLAFLRDLLTYGSDNPASSQVLPRDVAADIRARVLQLLGSHGETLTKQVIAGLVFNFNEDCYSNATGVLVSMLEMMPSQTMAWLRMSIGCLPAGTLTTAEVDGLTSKMQEQLQTPDRASMRQIRFLIDNFAFNYRRRHVAPRDGLGQLEAARFQFNG